MNVVFLKQNALKKIVTYKAVFEMLLLKSFHLATQRLRLDIVRLVVFLNQILQPTKTHLPDCQCFSYARRDNFTGNFHTKHR